MKVGGFTLGFGRLSPHVYKVMHAELLGKPNRMLQLNLIIANSQGK